MKSILVTGGAGFLGSNLCRKLLMEQHDADIICLDNFYTGRRKNLVELEKNTRFKLMEHDIIKPFPEDFCCDEIYNLACPASPPHYQKDPVYTTKISVLGILNVLELARRNGAKILQASTSEVYGEPHIHPQDESYRGNVNCTGIRSCYDEGKRCAESLMFDYHRMYGVRTKVLRIFNTYGPKMDPLDGRVVSNFIIEALKGKDITIYGDGHQTRSLCYVDDLLEGMVRVMKTEDDFIGPVNLGNPEEQTVKEIANKIIKITKSNSKIVFCPLPKDDPTQRCPDITLAKKKLNWKPHITSVEGLAKTVEYFMNELK